MDASNRKESAWPHAPVHKLSEGGTYFVTAGTYKKQHFFRYAHCIAVLQRGLLAQASKFGWSLEAWAVFSNHYHFVAHSPVSEDGAHSLSQMLRQLHERTAKWLNDLEKTPGRKVWHNFWETRLTYEKPYLGRLKYVHQNPVRHRLVHEALSYPWCSAAWFERVSTPAQVNTINSFKTDRLRVFDEFQPVEIESKD